MRKIVIAAVMAAALAGTAAAESLYREETFHALTGDRKAHRVGDVVTVQVLENSSASTSTDTSTQRKNNLNATLITPPSHQRAFGLATSGDFEGGGTTQRTNRLLATLTVSVHEVLPNGDLQLAGEQILTVNGEHHRVQLEGRVRPQDISDANAVLSTRLADARITYVGSGDLSERQKRSVWRSVMDWLGF